jgi:hypothetical protein
MRIESIPGVSAGGSGGFTDIVPTRSDDMPTESVSDVLADKSSGWMSMVEPARDSYGSVQRYKNTIVAPEGKHGSIEEVLEWRSGMCAESMLSCAECAAHLMPCTRCSSPNPGLQSLNCIMNAPEALPNWTEDICVQEFNCGIEPYVARVPGHRNHVREPGIAVEESVIPAPIVDRYDGSISLEVVCKPHIHVPYDAVP